MEGSRNTPGVRTAPRKRYVYALVLIAAMAVVQVNLVEVPACIEGGSYLGRPLVYAYACNDPGHPPTWSQIATGALWVDAAIWGLIFGAIALALRIAQGLPPATPGSGRPREAPR